SAGTPELLDDIDVEQRQVTAALDQQAVRVRALADKEEAAARALADKAAAEAAFTAKQDADGKAKQEEDIQKQRDNLLSWVSAFVGLVFVFDLALAIAQVRQGGSDWS